MTTVVNTPATERTDNSGMGLILGVILAIAFIFLLLYFGLPTLRGTGGNTQTVPQGDSGGNTLNVDVPKDVDVNVNPNPAQ